MTPLTISFLWFLAADPGFGSKRKQERFYIEQAAAAQSLPVQRTGSGHTEGRSAHSYQSAWDACLPVQGLGLGKERDRGARQLSSALRSLRSGQSKRGRRTPLPPSCEAIGGTPDDPLMAVMQDQGCALIQRCQAAIPHLIEGSTRQELLSPLAPYEAWRVQGDIGRPSVDFLVLGQVALADAWLSGGRQDPKVLAERALVVLRYGRDLGQGVDGRDLRVSLSTQEQALELLHRVVSDPTLDPALALRIAQELEAVAAQPVDLGAVVQVDFLETTAMIWSATRPKAKALEQAPLLYAPDGPAWNPEAWELPKVAGPVVSGYLEDQHFPTWYTLERGLGSQYLANETMLSEALAELSVSGEGTRAELQGMVANGLISRLELMQRWNLELGLINSRVCLLATAARARAGEPGGSCAVDPMLGQPYGQDADAKGVLLWAPALESVELSRTQQRPLEIDVAFPETPAAGDHP